MLSAGQRDRLITFQQKVKVSSLTGAVTYTWQNIAVDPTEWAERFDRSGTEGFTANNRLASATTRFRLRHRTDIFEDMRVLDEGIAYDIKAALDVSGSREFLELMCERGKVDG